MEKNMSEKNIDIDKLRDTEQGILNYMLLSNNNFLEIKNKLSENDFTFLLHRLIFEGLIILEEMFLSDNFHGVTDSNTILNIFAKVLERNQNVKFTSTLDILSQTPSRYIETDLEIINTNSMEREIAIHSDGVRIKGTIETKDGSTWFNFINNKLINVGTTNISKLPIELHDSFENTLNSFSNLDLENGNNELSMTFYGDPEEPEGIESFYLKKDVDVLKWFNNICQWADKYDLKEDIFLRDRYKLQDLSQLDISNQGINELPKEIINLSNLKVLTIDHNNIKEFPKELYQLKKLRLLSFINNKISYLSDLPLTNSLNPLK